MGDPAVSNRRCVIIGGADIGNYDLIKDRLKDNDFCVFCDIRCCQRFYTAKSL